MTTSPTPGSDEAFARPFAAFLTELAGGRTHAELGESLHLLVGRVLDTGKKGLVPGVERPGSGVVRELTAEQVEVVRRMAALVAVGFRPDAAATVAIDRGAAVAAFEVLRDQVFRDAEVDE